jgi:hypothetical protein
VFAFGALLLRLRSGVEPFVLLGEGVVWSGEEVCHPASPYCQLLTTQEMALVEDCLQPYAMRPTLEEIWERHSDYFGQR